jgi:DNA/RNA-binding domain of Phe-tRNA-synthetase-like protein
MEIINECREKGLRAAVVVGRGIAVLPSPQALDSTLRVLIETRAREEFPPPDLKEKVRGMLRKGGFKPTGRNKPASEYLAQAAREGRFPFINNLVDINNYLSLLSGLPISLLDLEETGEKIILRNGRKEESFVFNSAGQVIDVEGLMCICSAGGPALGNPVKDSLQAKLKDTTSHVVGVIYAPAECVGMENLREYGESFAAMLREYGGAKETEVVVV